MDHFDACAGPQHLDFGRINIPCTVCAARIQTCLDDTHLAARFAIIELQYLVFVEEAATYNPDQAENVRCDPDYFERTRQKGNEAHAYTLACMSLPDAST